VKAPSPSREGLIVGGALVALYGFEMETIATLRAHQVANWNEHPTAVACRTLAHAIRDGQAIVQEDDPMWRSLAHAQQVMRVSLDEWETVLRITPLPQL
jgi:hypothetical protein